MGKVKYGHRRRFGSGHVEGVVGRVHVGFMYILSQELNLKKSQHETNCWLRMLIESLESRRCV